MIEQLCRVDPAVMERLAAIDAAAFGAGGLSVWHLAPLIRHGRVFIFRQDGVIAASVQYMLDWEQRDTAYMVGVAVDEHWRGQGIAYALLRESFRLLQRQSLRYVELTVAPENAAALALYESKLGFSRSGYRENEYGPGEHRLILTLDLNGREPAATQG
ncbi:MAG: GNAT family N-acetyltransferase [Sporomusaceae bacterium]|nr:GNAT family N-acetyltransferase [Sporomusaceae bacterium]